MKIFISYRRDDAPYAAYMLRDRIAARYGTDSAFLDHRIAPGQDWQQEIEKSLVSCDAAVVIMGDKFIACRSTEPLRGIEEDPVRWEIEKLIELGKPICPLIVGKRIEMPTSSQLPERMKPFASAQASYALHQAYDFGMNLLCAELGRRFAAEELAPAAQVSGTRTAGANNSWRLAVLSLMALGLVVLCGLLINQQVSGAHWDAHPLAVFAGATITGLRFVLLSTFIGFTPHATLKIVSIFRAELRMPIVTPLSTLFSINLCSIALFTLLFLQLSTLDCWRLRPVGTSLTQDLTMPQYVMLAASLLVWVLTAVVTGLIERWCGRQNYWGALRLLPLFGQIAGLLVGAYFWVSLYRSFPSLRYADPVATIGYFCLTPAVSFITGFFNGNLTHTFPTVTRSTIYQRTVSMCGLLWASCVLALFAHGVEPALRHGVTCVGH